MDRASLGLNPSSAPGLSGITTLPPPTRWEWLSSSCTGTKPARSGAPITSIHAQSRRCRVAYCAPKMGARRLRLDGHQSEKVEVRKIDGAWNLVVSNIETRAKAIETLVN